MKFVFITAFFIPHQGFSQTPLLSTTISSSNQEYCPKFRAYCDFISILAEKIQGDHFPQVTNNFSPELFTPFLLENALVEDPTATQKVITPFGELEVSARHADAVGSTPPPGVTKNIISFQIENSEIKVTGIQIFIDQFGFIMPLFYTKDDMVYSASGPYGERLSYQNIKKIKNITENILSFVISNANANATVLVDNRCDPSQFDNLCDPQDLKCFIKNGDGDVKIKQCINEKPEDKEKRMRCLARSCEMHKKRLKNNCEWQNDGPGETRQKECELKQQARCHALNTSDWVNFISDEFQQGVREAPLGWFSGALKGIRVAQTGYKALLKTYKAQDTVFDDVISGAGISTSLKDCLEKVKSKCEAEHKERLEKDKKGSFDTFYDENNKCCKDCQVFNRLQLQFLQIPQGQ